MACKCWCLICWHLKTEIGLIDLSRLNALPRSVFQGQWMIDGSILFLSAVAGRQIAPATGQMWLRRSSLVAIRGGRVFKPSRLFLGELGYDQWHVLAFGSVSRCALVWMGVNRVHDPPRRYHFKFLARPVWDACHSHVHSAREREKGHVHPPSEPGRVLPSRSTSAVGGKMFR